jgi:hypothetical protein
LCAGQLSAATKTTMVNALNATSITSSNANTANSLRLNRVYAAVLMVMASAEYLIQK